MNPLFAIDIGNSTTGIALYGNPYEGNITDRIVLSSAMLRSPRKRAVTMQQVSKVFGGFLERQGAKALSVASSVVPDLNLPLTELFKAFSIATPIFISHRNSPVLSFKIKAPETLGADRIANATGAYSLYGGPVAVLDLGTATTVSIADGEGGFIGGAIMPGIQTMLDSLKRGTALLPAVDIEGITIPLGQDTASAMLSGVIIGTAGALERIIKDIEKAQGFRLQLVLTGGYSDLMRRHIKRGYKFNPYLIYEGLRQIYLRGIV